MSGNYIVYAIGLSAVITFFLRALPFLFFGKMRAVPEWLDRLGKNFPAAIMAILIVYCLKNVYTEWNFAGLPEVLSVLTLGITYKWKHNTFVSILAGTICNMVLLRMQ